MIILGVDTLHLELLRQPLDVHRILGPLNWGSQALASSILKRWQQIAMDSDEEGPHRSALGASSGRATGRGLVPLAADALARGAGPKGPYTLVDARSSPVPLKLTWWA